VVGNLAYLASGNRVPIINVSNPISPSQVGYYPNSGIARGIFVAGNYAYVADNATGLKVINVSNPAAPTLANSFLTAAQPGGGIFVRWNYA
jgi:hypothetical protein